MFNLKDNLHMVIYPVDNAKKVEKFSNHWWWVSLILITVCGALLRFAYYCRDNVVKRDGIFYLLGAKVWYETNDFNEIATRLIPTTNTNAMEYYTAPLYLFILKTIKQIFPRLDFEAIAAIWGIMVGTVLIVLIFFIAKKIFNNTFSALLCAYLICFHPVLTEMSALALRDMTYLTLSAAVLLLFVDGYQTHCRWTMCFAGIFAFANIFCRVESLALFAVLSGIILYSAIFGTDKKHQWLFWWLGCVCGWLIFTLILGVPWDFLIKYVHYFI